MKKIYAIAVACFITISFALPFVIEVLYRIGKKHPLIIMGYSQGEILTYIAAVTGVLISMIAIFVSMSANEPKFKISYARTLDDNNQNAIFIQIFNDSNYDCNVLTFCFINKAHNHRINICKGFCVPARGYVEKVIETKELRKKYDCIASKEKGKVYIEISYGINRNWYLPTSDILLYLEED